MNELEKELAEEYTFYYGAIPQDYDDIDDDTITFKSVKYYKELEDNAERVRIIVPKLKKPDFEMELVDGKKYVFLYNQEYDHKRFSAYIYKVVESMKLGYIDEIIRKLPKEEHPYSIEMDNKDVFSFIASGQVRFLLEPYRLFVPKHIQMFNPGSIKELMVFIEENIFDTPSPNYHHHYKEYSEYCSKLNYENIFKKDKRVSKILAISYDKIITLDQVFRLAVEVGGMGAEKVSYLISKLHSEDNSDRGNEVLELSNEIITEIQKNSSLEQTEIENLNKRIKIRLYNTVNPFQHLSGLYDNAIISYWSAYYYYLFPEIAKEPFDTNYKTIEELLEEMGIEETFYRAKEYIDIANKRTYEMTFLEFVEAMKKEEDYDGDITEKIRKELS